MRTQGKRMSKEIGVRSTDPVEAAEEARKRAELMRLLQEEERIDAEMIRRALEISVRDAGGRPASSAC